MTEVTLANIPLRLSNQTKPAFGGADLQTV